jgi:hypothetical protein
MKNTEHIVFNVKTQRFECTLCGKWIKFSFPIDVTFLSKVGKLFIEEHKKCQLP